MKATGLTREIDGLGRIVIPKALRQALNLHANANVEFFTSEDMLIIKRYGCRCLICNGRDHLIDIGDYKICRSCLKEAEAKIAAGEKD